MGKAKKSKKGGLRYDPLARGDAMAVDSQPQPEPKQLSTRPVAVELGEERSSCWFHLTHMQRAVTLMLF